MWILCTGQKVKYRQEGNRLFVTGLPEKAPDPLFPVLELKLNGKPRGIPNPLSAPGKFA